MIVRPRQKGKGFNKVFDTPRGASFDINRDRQRGLWEKGGNYYVQLKGDRGQPFQYKLHGEQTIPEARASMQALKLLQQDGKLCQNHNISPGAKPSASPGEGIAVSAAILGCHWGKSVSASVRLRRGVLNQRSSASICG